MKNLYFDFEVAGVPVNDTVYLGIFFLECKKHVAHRLAELKDELDQYPDGVVIINIYEATYLTDEPIGLKAFRYPDDLCEIISSLIDDDDLGIIISNIEAHERKLQ